MKHQKLLTAVIVMILAVCVCGYTYSKWSIGASQTSTNVFRTGCLEPTITEDDAIKLTNLYPVTDSEGLNNTPLTFSVKNNCTKSETIQINLELFTDEKSFTASDIRYSLNDSTPDYISKAAITDTTINGATSAFALATDTIDAGTTHEYNLKIWIDENLTTENATNKTFISKISIITSYGK
jgi:hypothetical protein